MPVIGAVTSGLVIIHTQTFTGNGTWTKPSGAVLVRLVMCGGGGGGRRNAAGSSATAGYGATSAPMLERFIPANTLSSTVSVTVGAGGAGATTTNTNGASGGDSYFGSLEVTGGVKGGSGGGVGAKWAPEGGGAPSPSYGLSGTERSAVGGQTADFTAGADGAIGVAGGGGSSTSGSASTRAGGLRSRYRTAAVTYGNAAGGTTGGATGGDGTAGAAGDITIRLGGGGGGSGGGGTTTGGVGGAGGVPGGGGGGGGGGVTTSGNGGNGGDGRVYVETWG